MNETHVNKNVPIVVLPSATKASYAGEDRRKIEEAVRSHLLLQSAETYHKVHVLVKHRPDGTPQTLYAYMLRAYTYTADVARLVVDANYSVRSIDASYKGYEDLRYAERSHPHRAFAGPKDGPDMVFGTPVPEIPTAKAAVEAVCKIAAKAGFKVVKLLGKDANVANYRQYLGGHLKAFGSVGHGYTGGIVLFDGNLTSAWFSNPKVSLKPEIVYFNSCQVFNPPLLPAIVNAGVRTFAGGKVNLLIGPSEKVFRCFWLNVLTKASKMGPTLKKCKSDNYPTAGAHGITGDLGKF